jgi:hypothetical protein
MSVEPKYDAITVDTNIFDQNHLKLDEGMLNQLAQFKDSLTQFILSEIIAGELKRHLTKQAQNANDSLTASLRKIGDSELLFEQPYWDLLEKADAALAPEEAAKARFDRFVKATDCEIIPADKADMTRLIKMYFDPSAPFEPSSKKKNEFPDAIALITLEDWAKRSEKKILAISKDEGWVQFAEKSDWIVVEKDLAAGLERLLADDAEKAREIVADLLLKMEKGEAADQLASVEAQVEHAVEDLMPLGEGESGYYMDGELAELSFLAMTFVRDADDAAGFQIVQANKERIVAKVAVEIEANATASFKMQVRDEGEYIPVATGHGDTDIEFDAGILITLGGDFTVKPIEFDIDEVELVDEIKSIDFGTIEIDWDPDDRYETD